MQKECKTVGGYREGHPWYYVLGGEPPKLKEIREAAVTSGYRGCREEAILKADHMPEPKRSETLRCYRTRALEDLDRDIRVFRKCGRDLRRFQREPYDTSERPRCLDVHVAMSLKYNHLYNDFAHLKLLDELLSRQRDLFDC